MRKRPRSRRAIRAVGDARVAVRPPRVRRQRRSTASSISSPPSGPSPSGTDAPLPSRQRSAGAPATSRRSLADLSDHLLEPRAQPRGCVRSGAGAARGAGIQLADQRVEVVPSECRSSAFGQRLVQKPQERGDPPEDRQQPAIELRAGGERRLEFAAGEELPELQILRRVVILREPARHALQPFAVERADVAAERRATRRASAAAWSSRRCARGRREAATWAARTSRRRPTPRPATRENTDPRLRALADRESGKLAATCVL